MYGFLYSQLSKLRYQARGSNEKPRAVLYDPPALAAKPCELPNHSFQDCLEYFSLADIFKIFMTIPGVVPEVLSESLPYLIDCAVFGAFVVWNGGIVLGSKFWSYGATSY